MKRPYFNALFMGFSLTQKSNIYAEIGGAGYLGTINFERVFLEELLQYLVIVPKKTKN